MARWARGMWLLGAALLLLAAPAAADSKVKGKVKDSAGAAIAGAKVSINDPSSGRSYNLSTGKDGSFYQRGVLPATYTLKVEREGYTPHVIEEIKVQAGLERSFDIVLKSVSERQAQAMQEQGLAGFAAGAEAFKAGDFETALAKADQQIADKPEDARGYDLKAKALISMKRYAEALPLLEKELTLANPVADARDTLVACTFNAGIAASREDKLEPAVGFWEKAVTLGYSDPQVHRLLGDAYLQLAQYDKARINLNAYLEKKPGAADAAQVEAILTEIQKLEARK